MSIRRSVLPPILLCLLTCAGLSAQTTTVPAGQKFGTENSRPVTGVRILPQPDGTVWFLLPANDRIVQLQADGVTMKQWQIRADKDLGANPVDFKIDGNIVWFIENGESLIDAGRSIFARLDTSTGQLREWDIPGSKPAAFSLTSDNKVWLPQTNGRLQLVDLNTLDVVDYRSTSTFAYSDMVTGPDGAFWLTDFGNNRIVRYVPGSAQETSWTFFDPNSGRLNPSQIRFDDSGLLWISQLSGAQMNRFDPATGELDSYPGFVNPIHFDLFAGRLYVAAAPDANGRVVVLDPQITVGLGAQLTPETLTVGASPNPLPAKIIDSTITPTTFTSTVDSFAATDLVTTTVGPGMLRTEFPSRNAYGIGVAGGTVWVGSDALLARLVLQTIGAASDLTTPVAAVFGVSPGTRITTDATLYNRGSAVVSGNVLFLYSPGAFAASSPFTVNPGQTVLLQDVLSGASSNAGTLFGPVRFQVTAGTAGDLSATVRSARQLDDGSSFGFEMPALSSADSVGAGTTRTLFLGNRASEISIFGLYAPGGASATVRLLAPDGTVRGSRDFSLAANIAEEFNPAASAFGVPPEPGDVLSVSVSSGALQPYVNVLDTGSLDVAASLPVAPTTDAVIPIVGTLMGLGDTSFVSDLFLANSDPGSAANVTVSYLPLGSSRPPLTAAVALTRGGSAVIEDVLGTLFAVTAGQGTLLVSSDAPVAVSTRVASRRPEGDYATFAPALGGSEAIPDAGTATAFGVPQTATRRTHLLLFNRGAAGTVMVVGYDGDGNQIGQLPVAMAAGGASRVDSVMRQLGVASQSAGRIAVMPASGMVVYAQTAEVDADTGDLEIARLRQ
jgi:sugar lactone lactonase YvrE